MDAKEMILCLRALLFISLVHSGWCEQVENARASKPTRDVPLLTNSSNDTPVSSFTNGTLLPTLEYDDRRLVNMSTVYREFRIQLGTFHWERALSSVPVAIAVLGDLWATASNNEDWSLIPDPTGGQFDFIRQPSSFRATLIQIKVALYDAFLALELWMAQLQSESLGVPVAMKRLVFFIESDPDDREVDANFQLTANQVLEAVHMGADQTAEVQSALQYLVDLSIEVANVTKRTRLGSSIDDSLNRLVAVWNDLFEFYRGMDRVVNEVAAVEFQSFYHLMEGIIMGKGHDVQLWVLNVLYSDELMNRIARTDQAAYLVHQMAHSFLNVCKKHIMPPMIELDRLTTLGRGVMVTDAAGHSNLIIDRLVESKVRIVQDITLRECLITEIEPSSEMSIDL